MIFTCYLQKAFDVPLVIQITDDEKYLYNEKQTWEQTLSMRDNNIKDIIAFGFDPEKTFIFCDSDYIQQMYPNIIKTQKHITLSQIRGIFGFKDDNCVGKFAYPPI